jgi:hypothetical protein
MFLINLICFVHLSASAQTDADAIMMSKNNFCTGIMYSGSHWTDYWEGTLKRTNDNLGIVSTKMTGIMGNYGVSDKLNILFGLPYVQTNASAGTLKSQKGIQDLSLWIKWMPIEKTVGKGILSVYGIGGYSLPVTNYIADFLPLSLGLRSKNISLRGMVDYQIGKWFATVSGTYVVRSNITIDRTAYYTTSLHLTNEVEMPDQSSYSARIGYRSNRLIAEAIYNRLFTLGGFDITRNNMPFPSNKMNATTYGVNIKYTLKKVDGLSLIGGGNITPYGRNVGQSTSLNGGIFYILDFSPKKKKSSPISNKQ